VNETHVVVSEREVAEDVRAVVAIRLRRTGHRQLSKLTRLVDVWPVLVTLDSAALYVRRQHDHQRRTLVPHHLPEVVRRLRQRSLRRDVAIDHSRPWNLHLQSQNVRRIGEYGREFYVISIFARYAGPVKTGELL